MEMQFWRPILNKTKENLRLELGVDEIKNEIQKSRLRWFGHVMWIGEENGVKMTKEKIHNQMDRLN